MIQMHFTKKFLQMIPVAIMLGALIGALLYATVGTSAKDAEGCEGLSDYRIAMLKAGHEYVDTLTEDGIPPSRDVLTYSSDDWNDLADDVVTMQIALKAIPAPEWVKEWH